MAMSKRSPCSGTWESHDSVHNLLSECNCLARFAGYDYVEASEHPCSSAPEALLAFLGDHIPVKNHGTNHIQMVIMDLLPIR